MTQPSDLRVQETIIEEFGVSRKYTVLLAVLGLSILGLAVLSGIEMDPLIRTIALGAGPLAPLVFRIVEVILAAAGLLLIGRAIYLVLAYHFFLTSERVIERVGFLSEREVSADYKAITDIVVDQDPISRLILNTGAITINTPGGEGEEVLLASIDNPQARREQLRALSRAAAQGQPSINPSYLASLKVQTGMAKDLESALSTLCKPVIQSDVQP